ncbi:hypothetical protein [Aeromonas phage phiA014S]|uniref:Uncharacterized protein n=1 Tax=Aeromonas phage phiA014S TaxID=3119845 RepID=A0ABZ2CLV9_9CAUD
MSQLLLGILIGSVAAVVLGYIASVMVCVWQYLK